MATMKRSPWMPVAAAVVVILAGWMLWPSKYARVANRDSHGANVIAFGDSLTAGYGAGTNEDYPSHLSSMLGTPVINAGVNGDTTAAALARLDADVLAHDPRLVIVGLGGNDFLQDVPISGTEENLRAIFEHLERNPNCPLSE